MFLFAGRRLRRPEHRPRRRLFECSRPWRRTDRSGRSLRRARPKRTCGTRAAGLRRREAAARSAFPRPKFSIQNSVSKDTPGRLFRVGPRPAKTAGDARSCGPSPPPGCGPHGLFKADFHPSRARSRADGLAFERRGDAALRQGAAAGCRSRSDRFCRPAFTLGLQLAKRLHERTPKRTRAAGLRGAKLRPAAASLKPQIQHSKFKIQNYCSGCSLRRPHTTARSCGPPPPPGCGPHGLFKAGFHPSRALRPRAAAGCRRPRRRICRKTPARPAVSGCHRPSRPPHLFRSSSAMRKSSRTRPSLTPASMLMQQIPVRSRSPEAATRSAMIRFSSSEV